MLKKKILKEKYKNLPEKAKKPIRFFYNFFKFLPLSPGYKKRRWIKKVYSRFSQEQREYIFLSIARFCQINRPINGYYFEFGCCGARTMRMAWDAFHHLHLLDFTYVGFDSFQGFPEISEIDKQEIFKKGGAEMDEKGFIKKVTGHGMPREKLITIKGFFAKGNDNRF